MKLLKSGWNLFARGINGFSEVTGMASGLSILGACIVITYGVVIRYMHMSTTWQNELATYLLLLAVFIGAAYTQKHHGHISILMDAGVLQTATDFIKTIQRRPA